METHVSRDPGGDRGDRRLPGYRLPLGTRGRRGAHPIPLLSQGTLVEVVDLGGGWVVVVAGTVVAGTELDVVGPEVVGPTVVGPVGGVVEFGVVPERTM